MALPELAEQWRGEAARLRSWGAAPQADAIERCAAELDAAVREHALEALTLEEAATESGYSYSALEKGIRAGRIVNAGSKGAPRVRRVDLPRKGRIEGPGLAEDILSRRLG